MTIFFFFWVSKKRGQNADGTISSLSWVGLGVGWICCVGVVLDTCPKLNGEVGFGPV